MDKNNNKTLVLYKTKYGGTEQYAKWIADELRADISNVQDFEANSLDNYNTVIIGSPTYMGKIQMKDFLDTNWDSLKNKKVFLFNVGVIPWESPDSKKNFEMIPEHIRNKIGFTKMPGRLDKSKLNFFEKLLVRMLKVKTDDNVKKENIKPIINWIKELPA